MNIEATREWGISTKRAAWAWPKLEAAAWSTLQFEVTARRNAALVQGPDSAQIRNIADSKSTGKREKENDML